MISTPKRLTWIPFLLLSIFLSSALLFLYIKTRDYDPSNYFKHVALLRQIKQLDTRWELDAMKSKIGTNKTYDPLVAPLKELNNLQQQLDGILIDQKSGFSPALKTEISAFDNALLRKTQFVENFKSHNAVLRNSLTFLPTAADDIQDSLIKSGNPHLSKLNNIAMSVNKILLASLVYDQTSSEDKIAEIESDLNRLTDQQKDLPTDINRRISIFIAHVHTLIREHNVVNALLKNIAMEPTASHIDAINTTLNSEHQRQSERIRKYDQYLLIFAAALAGLFLYAVVRLIRNHSVIKQMNMELQHANENLELRVEQRTQELNAVQAELISTARRAGMAEIATNVLHNVGNILNSVNVSAGVINNRVRTSKVTGLSKVVHLLNEHTDDLGDFLTQDQKGKVLPDYLTKLADTLSMEQKAIGDELVQMTKSIDHIKEIVATQQSYAGTSKFLERAQVSELIDDAIKMNSDSLSHHQVHLEKEFAKLPAMLVDKHKVLQILINLIGNAKNAMRGVNDREYQITIRLVQSKENTIQIQVADNGEGIPPENLSRIFAHGFTTREDGHGFGLHSCVLAAREMGGSLTVHSDGIGQGATFTLEFPIKEEARTEAATEAETEATTKVAIEEEKEEVL